MRNNDHLPSDIAITGEFPHQTVLFGAVRLPKIPQHPVLLRNLYNLLHQPLIKLKRITLRQKLLFTPSKSITLRKPLEIKHRLLHIALQQVLFHKVEQNERHFEDLDPALFQESVPEAVNELFIKVVRKEGREPLACVVHWLDFDCFLGILEI